jgi:hypothetical protein
MTLRNDTSSFREIPTVPKAYLIEPLKKYSNKLNKYERVYPVGINFL